MTSFMKFTRKSYLLLCSNVYAAGWAIVIDDPVWVQVLQGPQEVAGNALYDVRGIPEVLLLNEIPQSAKGKLLVAQ